MAKQVYSAFTKEAYLEAMAKSIPDDYLIVTSNVLDGAEVVKRKSSIKVNMLHAQEFFKTPESVGFIAAECIPISTLFCQKSCLSADILKKLKEGKGMYGFSIENQF